MNRQAALEALERLELLLLLVMMALLALAYAFLSGAWQPAPAVQTVLYVSMTCATLTGRLVRFASRYVQSSPTLDIAAEVGTDVLELQDRSLLMWRVLAFASGPAYPVTIVFAEVTHRPPNVVLAGAFVVVASICTTALARSLNRRWWIWLPLTLLFAGIPALILSVQPRVRAGPGKNG